MQFEIPSTKSEMYSTLQDIFHYYRIQRESYQGLTLSALAVTRMSFTPLTAEQIRAKAEAAVAAKHERETAAKTAEINASIAAKNGGNCMRNLFFRHKSRGNKRTVCFRRNETRTRSGKERNRKFRCRTNTNRGGGK